MMSRSLDKYKSLPFSKLVQSFELGVGFGCLLAVMGCAAEAIEEEQVLPPNLNLNNDFETNKNMKKYKNSKFFPKIILRRLKRFFIRNLDYFISKTIYILN